MMRKLMRAAGHVARTRLAEELGGTPPGPMMAYVELTRRCNLRCRQCEIWKTSTREPDFGEQEMSPALLGRVLREMHDMGLAAVDLIGGEPLLRRDLETIVADARRIGLHVTVTTNGWGLDEKRVEALVAAGVSQVLVSLDGADAALHDELRGRAGAFERAVAGVRRLRAAAPELDVGVNVVVSRANAQSLDALVDLALDLGVSCFRMLPYHSCYPFSQYDGADDGLAVREEEVKALAVTLPALRRRLVRAGVATNAAPFVDGIADFFRGRRRSAPCSAGFLVCDIVANGDLMTCFGCDEVVGNVREASFRELWRRPVLAAHRERLRNQGCTICWQSCYVEPALRTRIGQSLSDPAGLIEELKRYF